jgi:hypothetical protein
MRELRLWAAAAAGPALAAGFYALATVRRRRSLHPVGMGYQGWLQVPDEGPRRPGVPLFQAGAARVNVSEADFLGNHCVVVVASFGWLIQTAPGSAGGAGGLLTKRLGCWS